MKGTLKTMAWVKFKFMAGWGAATLLATDMAGIAAYESTNEPPQNPELVRQMFPAIFSHISPPLPAQMRFIAEVEVVNKPWTEEQISNEVNRTEEFIFTNELEATGTGHHSLATYRKQWFSREKESIAQNTEEQRLAHGTRIFSMQEWLADDGALWRLDKNDTTVKPDNLRTLDKQLPAGVEYETTMIQMYTNSSKLSSTQIYNRQRAVWFDSSNFEKENRAMHLIPLTQRIVVCESKTPNMLGRFSAKSAEGESSA